MPRHNRIRNNHVTLQFIEEGRGQLTGSLNCNTDWKASPVGEISTTELTGENEDAIDQTHRGWDFSGGFQEQDAAIDEMYERRVAAIEAGRQPPELQIIVTKRYTDGVTAPKKWLYYGELALKLDSTEGTGKDFIKNSLSGKCQKRKLLPV